MASENEIRMLRQQLAETQERIRRLQQQTAQTIDAENKRLTQEIRTGIMQTYQNYQEAFNAETAKLRNLHTQEISAMRKQYEALLKRQQELEQNITGKQAELEALLHELRDESAYQNTRSAHEAQTACKRLESECERVRRTAAEHFFPQKLRIYVDALRRAKELMVHKLFPQAQAAAYSGLLGVQRLENDTERKQGEFHNAVLLYQIVYQNICGLLHSEAAHCANGLNLRLSDHQIDFWSDGLYSALLQELSEHCKLLTEISENETTWLLKKCCASDAVKMIRQKTAELEQLPDLFRIALNTAFSACACFEESYKIRSDVSICLKDQGYQFLETRYGSMPAAQNAARLLQMYASGKQLPAAIQRDGIPDLREERRMIWQHTGMVQPEYAVIHLYPVRQEDRFINRMELEVNTPHDPQPLYECLHSLLVRNGIHVQQRATGSDYAHCRMDTAEARELLARRKQDQTSQSSVPAWSTGTF